MSDVASFSEYVAKYPNALQFLTLDAAGGAADQTGLARDGTASGGVTIGGAVGPGDLGATQFDGSNDAITATYSPFANGATKSFFGFAYRDSSAATHALFGGDAASGAYPQLRLSAANPAAVTYFPDNTGAGVTWNNVWTAAAWVWWILVHDATANTATLWINNVNMGVQTGLPAFPASPGHIAWGRVGTPGNLFWPGRMAYVGVVSGDISPDSVAFWSWGLSTVASRNPNFGLPGPTNFPSAANPPRGESLGWV